MLTHWSLGHQRWNSTARSRRTLAGPALLLRLDADEGVAVIQYQGKPYLVALRHIRAFKGIYLMEVQSPQLEDFAETHEICREHDRIYLYGWIKKKNQAPQEQQQGDRRAGEGHHRAPRTTWSSIWPSSTIHEASFWNRWNPHHLDEWKLQLCCSRAQVGQPSPDEEDSHIPARRSMCPLLLLLPWPTG